MIHTHFIGRIGKDAETIMGSHGCFISMDLATDNYSNGKTCTTWIRVRSKRENHINLAKYLTKGKLVLVDGCLNEPTIWTDKDGHGHVQLSIVADSINFVNIGKRKEDSTDSVGVSNYTDGNENEMPFPPADKEEDLPF